MIGITYEGDLVKLKNIQNSSRYYSLSYRLFCDLDGVITDLKKKASELIGEPYSEERFETDKVYNTRLWTVAKEYCAAGHEFWGEMEMLPDAQILWDYISKHNVEILSATGTSIPSAGDQKQRWVARNLGLVKVNLTRTARNKAQYAAPNHILIDDKQKAITPWEEAGGIGILHTSADSTIKQLKKLGL